MNNGWYFAVTSYECPYCSTTVKPTQIHVCLFEQGLRHSWSDGGVLPTKLPRGKRKNGVVIPRVPLREMQFG